MLSLRSKTLIIVGILLFCGVALATYYQPNFFPIGLTGINLTGDWNCPYEKAKDPYWTWVDEKALIEALGVNCIGCEDAQPHYLIDWGDASANYLTKVCKPLTDNDPDNPVYLIPASYYTTMSYHKAPGWLIENKDTIIYGRECRYDPCTKDSLILTQDSKFFLDTTNIDSCFYGYYQDGDSVLPLVDTVGSGKSNRRVSTFFRSPYRGYKLVPDYPGVGSMQFSNHTDSSLIPNAPCTGCGEYNRHGRNTLQGDNWNIFGGDSVWCAMADDAIHNFDTFFINNPNLARYIWGYNLITEDPGISRGSWRGCWAGVDRIFRGRNSTGFNVTYEDRDSSNRIRCHGTYECTSHGGARWVESRLDTFQGNRVIIAKGSTSSLLLEGHNIFAALPDLDAFVFYSHGWCHADWNYGKQNIFDWWLYGDPSKPNSKGGRHNVAIYFRDYGNTTGGPFGQKRRWISVLCNEWQGVTEDGNATARRPCPPETRCAAYLSLSRGAKGIMFHPWSVFVNDDKKFYPNNVPVPANPPDPGNDKDDTLQCTVGLRDHDGWPFGKAGNSNMSLHKLNSSASQAPYWSGKTDYTYEYLADTLIPELKKIGPTLVDLDWVNAYSLKSTAPGKTDTCPIDYVEDVSGAEYIDLGFFDHPYNNADYLMVVNREGIADMTNRTITVKIEYMGKNKIKVKNIATEEITYVPLNESTGCYHLTNTYEPGQGLLFKIEPYGEEPQLCLTGEWREAQVAAGFMELLRPPDEGGGGTHWGYAYMTWVWRNYVPATLTSMNLWRCLDFGSYEWTKAVRREVTDPYLFKTGHHCVQQLDSIVLYIEVGEHSDGDTIRWPENMGVGTKSNKKSIYYQNKGGCPDLYAYYYHDTIVSPGYVFLENNTILPHSEHIQEMDEDLLRLGILNDEPDHYYMSILENDDETSYLDQVKLWVVDHSEETQVTTSADDSIYCYSEMQAPETCKDNNNNDRLDEILWEDTSSFAGVSGSYLLAEFDDPGWSNVGLLISHGDYEEAPATPPKNCLSIPEEPDGGGGWDSLGVAYTRMNHSQWMVDVSSCDSFTFRVRCQGDDTCFIDRLALVKLESDYDITEAELDSAVHYDSDGDGTYARPLIEAQDTLVDTLFSEEQMALRFDEVDSSITYELRDYVFHSRGYYFSPTFQRTGLTEQLPLEFALHVEQITPLASNALINYSIPYATHVKITIYDTAGRQVETIVNGQVEAGRYSKKWSGCDRAGRRVASGVYFVKMIAEREDAGEYERTHKMVVLN